MEIDRTFRIGSKLTLKLFEGAVEGLIRGVLRIMGPERLSYLIENDRYILECVFTGMIRPPVYFYQRATKEEIRKVEGFRHNLNKTVLPVLGMARTIASRFPADLVEEKVTGEWLIERGKKHFPELVSVIEKHGEAGKEWVEKQARQIREYLLGRLAFDAMQMKFVPAEADKLGKKA